MALLASLVVFAAVFVFLLALASSEKRVQSRLAALRPRGETDDAPTSATVTQRLVRPLMDAPVRLVRRMLPTATIQRLQQRLILAGEPMEANAFLTLWLIVAGAFTLLPLLLVLSGAVASPLIGVMVLAGGALIGVMLPQMWLAQRVGARQMEIIKSLPDAFDLITTCVEAGLGLDASLARVAEKVKGPFSDELSRALHDMALGKSRREAMRELGERTGVPDLISFVNAVNQAEQMGSSLGNVLRVQSEQLRVRRRQRAEAQAYKAPVKMIFPLVLCIFPTLFIVILGPAVLIIMRDFPTN